MNRRSFVAALAPGLLSMRELALIDPSVADRIVGLGRSAHELPDNDFWKEVRRAFTLNPGVVHLNCGTLGATPRIVIDAITAVMREIEGNPAVNVFGPVGQRMNEVKEKAAAFLGAFPEEIALTRNTTEGMNMVASGLDLGPGDEVLTTNHEHHGGLVGWEHAEKHRGIRIVKIKMPVPVTSKDQILQLIEEHITGRTKVCSFSHISTITGLQMPMAEISEITRPRGIILVCDGAQAPGMLDVNVKELGVDTYASSSHKWMLASKGSGLLYIRKEMQERIEPVFLFSGYAPYTASSGTRNVAQILGHGVAMDFHEQIGKARVEARCRELNTFLSERLRALTGVRLITPDAPDLATGILSISLDRASNGAVATVLRDQNIIVKVIPIPEYNGLRLSTHIYNSENDLVRFVDALQPLL